MQASSDKTVVLGAGITGLSAAYAGGFTVLEENPHPGGICASYYIRPSNTERLSSAPPGEDAYRFERGGGHWIWGGDTALLRLLTKFSTLLSYSRAASVYLASQERMVPYPLQYHLGALDSRIARTALRELQHCASQPLQAHTLAEWLMASFGPTLNELFFGPFHDRYTSGLYSSIAPQDPAKSPFDLERATAGLTTSSSSNNGYNPTFLYPREGLNAVVAGLAARTATQYEARICGIDTPRRRAVLAGGREYQYSHLISTLPLDRVLEITGAAGTSLRPDPSTSVLVINLGATRGSRCPEAHWVYIPDSASGFYRVGFYSNIDQGFLPLRRRTQGTHVAAYIEHSRRAGQRPDLQERASVVAQTVRELQAWGWIKDVEVLDSTWVDTAYTWNWPGSSWTADSVKQLASVDIYQVGRYARWARDVTGQSILGSMRDGLVAGVAFSG